MAVCVAMDAAFLALAMTAALQGPFALVGRGDPRLLIAFPALVVVVLALRGHGPEEYAAATRMELSLSGVRMWLVRKAVHHRLYGLEVFPCLSDAELNTGEGAVR